MTGRLLAALVGALRTWIVAPRQAVAQAEFVLHNARVYTVNPDQPTAEAIAVLGERIAMVGSNAEVLAAFPTAERRDAERRTVVPGLIDAHAHLMGRGLSLLRADLVGTSSKDAVIERLKDYEERLPAGLWLTGHGWDQNDWPNQTYPTRLDLDGAFPDRPVWIERIDGHAAWANTAALDVAGRRRIRDAEDPRGGRILRDAAGEPTGIFIDAAMRLVSENVPAPTDEERREALKLVLQETARYGLTAVHDAGVDEDDIALYREAMDEGWLDLRVYAMIAGRGPTFDRFCGDGRIFGDRLSVRSVKYYVDGALGSRGAALLEPYDDEPESRGLLRTTPDAFADDVRAAIRCGFQVSTHAIGDRGTRLVLDTYEHALKEPSPGAGRHRIEHAQIVDPNDIPRFRELGVIASMQPIHATSDMYWAADRVGVERLEGAYAWRTFLEEGVRLAFGSDFPVEHVNPLLGFYAAVTRRDVEGWPEGGWLPDQILTREQALRAFTRDAAYAAFEEDALGTIEPGQYADFVVLTRDVMNVAAEEIPATEVHATYLGGKVIYHRSDPSEARSD